MLHFLLYVGGEWPALHLHWNKIFSSQQIPATNFESLHLTCMHVFGCCVKEIKIQGNLFKPGLENETIYIREIGGAVPQTEHRECKLHSRASCTDGVCKLSQASSCFPILHLSLCFCLSLSLLLSGYPFPRAPYPILFLPVIILCVTQSISLCQQQSPSACTTKI